MNKLKFSKIIIAINYSISNLKKDMSDKVTG